MTRTEQTSKRSLAFSGWIRVNLPDSSTGYCVTNQDWILWNFKTKKIMLLEEKTHNGDINKWFHILIKNILNPALFEYCPKENVTYLGYHLICFENTGPEDGKIYFDRKLITKEELIKKLTF